MAETYREAGFFPKTGCGPVATAGFGVSGPNGSIDGRIEGSPDISELLAAVGKE